MRDHRFTKTGLSGLGFSIINPNGLQAEFERDEGMKDRGHLFGVFAQVFNTSRDAGIPGPLLYALS